MAREESSTCSCSTWPPGRDGTVVLRELRAAGQRMPVVILTARDDVSDTVAGLEGGADDYVTKPFRFTSVGACARRG